LFGRGDLNGDGDITTGIADERRRNIFDGLFVVFVIRED
jgi:hypothetical protein